MEEEQFFFFFEGGTIPCIYTAYRLSIPILQVESVKHVGSELEFTIGTYFLFLSSCKFQGLKNGK